ncbi:ATP-dependent nuclease [Pseudomonas monteilii]|uniref:ATP-dependent nuclease n=1 Tax=Pseudomonas monteilii TaxID=76759 RepID=UPI0036E49FFA
MGLELNAGNYGKNFSRVIDFLEKNNSLYKFDARDFLRMFRGDCCSPEEIETAVKSFQMAMANVSNSSFNLSGGSSEARAFHELRRLVQAPGVTEDLSRSVSEFNDDIISLLGRKRYYVPILRGMRPLNESSDLYLERTTKDYFSQSKGRDKLHIITGFDLYELLVKFLLGQPADRQRIKDYERIIGHEFFGGAEITLIPEYGKDTVSVKIGNDDQFSIYDLGDGMQQVIIITSAAFLEAGDSIFYIEEPEACLHPGLLRKLALFLMNHTRHQYFATTHSNHLLDLAEIDSRVVIHKVSKAGEQEDEIFKVRECTRDRELLAELGVLASSVYLANSTIWVEGITDRLYLGVFLRKYIEEMQDGSARAKLEGLLENYHYTFVEYQGGTLGHWSFDEVLDERLQATRLCASAFLVADGDISGKGDRAAELERQLGMNLYVLGCKEIENLIPRDVIIRTAKNIFSKMRADKINGLSANMLDDLSLKIGGSYSGIGYHLDRALGLPGKGKNCRRVFAEESGTIKNKVKFCIAAVDEMNASDWSMSSQLNELCSKIFEHILAQNDGDCRGSS